MILGENFDNAMSPKETYLAHYGVKGMKWGVRKQRRQERKGVYSPIMNDFYEKNSKKNYESNKNYEPGISAKMTGRYLNRLDSRRAQAQYDRDRFTEKASKAKAKGKLDREAKNLRKAENNARIVARAKSETERVLKEAKNNKLSVYTKDMDRYAINRGRENVAILLGGTVGRAALSKFIDYKVPGTGYSVKPKNN